MNDIAHQLRAQKRCSTDPDYLERMALEEERRQIHMDCRMDLRAPRQRIALCVEEIQAIARSESDPVRQHMAVREAIAACARDLDRYSLQPGEFHVDLRAALADRSYKVADTNPRLGLLLERAIDWV
ncbi:hypothetical protein [Reyranella sp.]|jgi:hypothetical protein|uniref:hypothetical protein n=1 Tax=Reyranella sp. TaxID=1929291 RepID=UPI002F938D5F